MNKLQVKLLEANHYFVIPELNVIKDNSFDRQLFNIYYDEKASEFGVQVFGAVLQDQRMMAEYTKQLNKRFKLVDELNGLGEYDEDEVCD